MDSNFIFGLIWSIYGIIAGFVKKDPTHMYGGLIMGQLFFIQSKMGDK